MTSVKRCDNCCFSTYATGAGRAVLICRQKQGAVGRWSVLPLWQKCENFYPSRSANPDNDRPRIIPLTRGQFTVVDAEDYLWLSQYQWFAEGTAGHFYAVRKENGRSIKMHRQIMNAPDHLVVDHIDHDGLNNRRENLRICTFAENCRNRRTSRHKSSKYKGVHCLKRNHKWAAQVTCDHKRNHLGYFGDEIDAAKAYDRAALELFGEFASLNLPEEKIKGA